MCAHSSRWMLLRITNALIQRGELNHLLDAEYQVICDCFEAPGLCCLPMVHVSQPYHWGRVSEASLLENSLMRASLSSRIFPQLEGVSLFRQETFLIGTSQDGQQLGLNQEDSHVGSKSSRSKHTLYVLILCGERVLFGFQHHGELPVCSVLHVPEHIHH